MYAESRGDGISIEGKAVHALRVGCAMLSTAADGKRKVENCVLIPEGTWGNFSMITSE